MGDVRIGLVGLGKMGAPMARNLLRAGFRVAGLDLAPDAGRDLDAIDGFTRAESARGAARDAEVVILMLPDSEAVDALLWGSAGLAAALAAGTLLVDMGSSDPSCSRVNAQRLEAAGVGFLDAPVSGGVRRAVDGSLSIMIGGREADVARARPVLEALGRTLIHVGDAGAGHAVKALNNYVSAAGLIAVSEALVAARRFGIDPHVVNSVFNASTGKNNTTEHKVENFMLSGRYDSGFALALMRKDVETAVGFIDRMGSPGEFARKTLDVARDAERALGDGADHTAVHAWVSRRVPD
ncbi:MAG: NAD(P)-dependent oxidoreductase [Burkholderiaceae bacterium]